MAAVNRKQAIEVLTSNFSNVSSVAVVANLIDKSKLTYSASAVYTDGADTVTATVCSANGKMKVYQNADDIVKDFAKGAPGASTITLSVGVDAITPETISLDPSKQLAKDKIKNAAALTRQTAVVAKLDMVLTEISSYQSGNSAQVAAYNKVAGERAVANALKVFIAALPQP